MIDRPVAELLPTTIEGAGAVVHFHGVVRPEESGKMLNGLDYSSYDPMAERELRRIAEHAVGRFGLLFVGITHSRGFVAANAASLLLVVAAAHRKPALAGMDNILDMLKRDVPIWKRPVWDDVAERLE